MTTEIYDVIGIGAGPTGLACAIEAKRAGLRPLVIDKGCLCNSLFHYPVNMLFFTTPERMEIGDLPMTISGGKPSRAEALKYYRRAVEHYGIETKLYEKVDRTEGTDGEFEIHTRDASGAGKNIARGKSLSPPATTTVRILWAFPARICRTFLTTSANPIRIGTRTWS